ncbi:MAG: undecaprenyl-diphosphate phosphatase [Kiritimatiellia bacterium]
MHDLLNVLFLALIQGLTEFLPVSSSGHLVIAQRLIGVNESGINLEIWLHIGTLISIVVFYRDVLWRLIRGVLSFEKKSLVFSGYVLISALPAVLFYGLFSTHVDAIYESTAWAGALLIFTGLVLIAVHRVGSRDGEVTWKRSIFVGIAQALAILPGISRSGMTISAARASGVSSEKAAEFSFIMVIPLLIGAALVNSLKVPDAGDHLSVWLLAVGTAVSAIVGWAALKILVKMLRKGRFWLFGVYCAGLGVLTLVLL